MANKQYTYITHHFGGMLALKSLFSFFATRSAIWKPTLLAKVSVFKCQEMVVAGNFLRLLLSPSICSKIPSTHSTTVLHPYKTAFFGNLNIDAKQRKTRRCNDNDLERVYNSNRDPWTPGYEVFPTSTGNVFVACIQNEQKLLLPPQLMRTFDGYGEEVCATKSVHVQQKVSNVCSPKVLHALWLHKVGCKVHKVAWHCFWNFRQCAKWRSSTYEW